MKNFVVAIPLFDGKMAVGAYRLLDHSGEKLFGLTDDHLQMSDAWQAPSLQLLEQVGIEPFTGGMRLYVDINQYQLLLGYPKNMRIPADQLVCVLPSNIPTDDAVVDRVKDLWELGYGIALDGPIEKERDNPILQMANSLMLDRRNHRFNENLQNILQYRNAKNFVIYNVPDMETYRQLSTFSNALFAGSFYNQPIT
ncbi:hypothetical protein LJC20_06300, partial [Eubacteriales bacterium OttesenSCG-928-M02]|nr:hypothetical protein [Eubacteriales bacterium OttesenSCG-928-M02]